MTAADEFPEVLVRRRKVANVLAGDPWVYPNAVKSGPDQAGLVSVRCDDNRHLGCGDYNPQAPVPIRLLTGPDEIYPGDLELLAERFDAAFTRRFRLGYQMQGAGVRLVNGEGDGLPGLVIDCFGGTLVIDLYSAGMLRRLPALEALFDEQFPDLKRIVRMGTDAAKREGVEPIDPADSGITELTFAEQAVMFTIPLSGSQKTGFYLDQRDNRRLVARYGSERRVLDLFCYHGGFALSALVAGAAEAIAVDSSAQALACAAANAERNDCQVDFRQGNVFKLLPDLVSDGPFELIICDPPKLAPKRQDKGRGLSAYRFLADRCLEALAPGGILLFASCSQAIGADDLLQILKQVSVKKGIGLDVLTITGQPSDHPWPIGFQTGRYLSAVFVERR